MAVVYYIDFVDIYIYSASVLLRGCPKTYLFLIPVNELTIANSIFKGIVTYIYIYMSFHKGYTWFYGLHMTLWIYNTQKYWLHSVLVVFLSYISASGQWKATWKGGFNGTNIYQWAIFHCSVWLPEGIFRWYHHLKADAFHGTWRYP